MNDIGYKLGMNLMKYVRPLNAYIMRSSHQHLKPTLLAVTEFVFEVLDPIHTCTQIASQVVNTIIECVDSYHSVERAADSAAPPLPPEGNVDPPLDEEIIVRDYNCTADSAASRQLPHEGKNDVHVEEVPLVEGYLVQNGNRDNEAIGVDPPDESIEVDASAVQLIEEGINYGITGNNLQEARPFGGEINPNSEKSSVEPTASFRAFRDEQRRQNVEDDEVQSLDSVEKAEIAHTARVKYDLTRADYSYNEVCFKPGVNISPSYWMQFLKERITTLFDIKDLCTFSHNDFVMRNEHLFGKEFRENCAKRACDHIVFSVHQDAFKIPHDDRGLKIQYLHKQRSPLFKLPPRKATGGSAELSTPHMIFNESVLRRFSRAIADSVICDAGIQFSIIQQLDGELPDDVPQLFKNDMLPLICPCCKMMENWRRFYDLQKTFDRKNLFCDKNRCATLWTYTDPEDPMEFNCQIRCAIDKVYKSPKVFFKHCCKSIDPNPRKPMFKDPFHDMIGIFLEYQYAQELPRCSLFDAGEGDLSDKTVFTNKKARESKVSDYKIGQGRSAEW